jgi:radical SAM superfamily enzyme YgiQ (UPF0313 family)
MCNIFVMPELHSGKLRVAALPWGQATGEAGSCQGVSPVNITFIVPAMWMKRNPIYRLGGKLYGHSNPITGPLILGGICKRAGHHVEVYQELTDSVNYRRLFKTTDVLCLYTMTSLAPRAYEIADAFHERGHARVIIGGMHASALPEEAMRHADQVMVGEGESTILDVVEGRLTDPIVRAEPVCDLDQVPFPDYSILKSPCTCANIMTSRGCPYRCSFCTTSRMFAPYRRRSVDSVIAEIRYCHELGFRYMNFEDDNFTADRGRAKEICRRIIDEGLQFEETFFFGRTDLANDEELLDLLSAAHLNRVLIGIESLNQDALDAIDKHQDVEDIRRATIACRDHGIRVIASCVLGLDEDGKEDIRRTVRFASSVDAYQIQPAILTPYPGTPVYEQFKREGRLISNNWQDYSMLNVTFQPKKMSPWDLQMEMYHAIDDFYTFPSAIRIGKLFGVEYGLRRIYLAIVTSWVPTLAEFVADHVPPLVYYRLKHTPWMFDPEHACEPVQMGQEDAVSDGTGEPRPSEVLKGLGQAGLAFGQKALRAIGEGCLRIVGRTTGYLASWRRRSLGRMRQLPAPGFESQGATRFIPSLIMPAVIAHHDNACDSAPTPDSVGVTS